MVSIRHSETSGAGHFILGQSLTKWTFPRKEWDLVLQQLSIHFEGRVPLKDYADRADW